MAMVLLLLCLAALACKGFIACKGKASNGSHVCKGTSACKGPLLLVAALSAPSSLQPPGPGCAGGGSGGGEGATGMCMRNRSGRSWSLSMRKPSWKPCRKSQRWLTTSMGTASWGERSQPSPQHGKSQASNGSSAGMTQIPGW